MQRMNFKTESSGDYLMTLHKIFKDPIWDVAVNDINQQIQLRAVRKKPILNLDAQNVHFEIIEVVRLHDEDYVRGKLEMFGRRLRG